MALGVCLLFNSRAERAIWELCDRLEECGVATLRSHTHGRHHAHLSYTVLVEWDLAAVRAAVSRLPDGGPIEVVFQAMGAFPRGRICLTPAVPPELLTRQLAVTAAVVEAGARVHKHYVPDNWLPHCAIAPRARLSISAALLTMARSGSTSLTRAATWESCSSRARGAMAQCGSQLSGT